MGYGGDVLTFVNTNTSEHKYVYRIYNMSGHLIGNLVNEFSKIDENEHWLYFYWHISSYISNSEWVFNRTVIVYITSYISDILTDLLSETT